MRSLRFSALGVALFGVCAAACAGIVGADFGDVHGVDGSPFSTDGGEVIQDSAPTIQLDSAMPVVVADGGVCPTGLTDCGGFCYALGSDPNHCNACDTHCALDPSGRGAAVCTGGHCTFACPSGYELCTGSNGCCSMGSVPDAGRDAGSAAELGILCGATHCPTANNGFCCGDNQDPPGGDVCANNDTSQNQVSCIYIFGCSSTDQCPGGSPACCYDQNVYDPNNEPNGQTSTCLSTCPGTPYIQLCNPLESGECTGGTTCTGTFDGGGGLQATYHYCQ